MIDEETTSMTPQEYYATQSAMSDPGKYAYLFDSLPDDIPGLCRVVQGIYVHYYSGTKFPPSHKRQVDTRNMSKILAKIVEMDERPLTEERHVQRRFVGCCRDASLLLCSMLRHRGIPARTRVGFAVYIRLKDAPGFKVDHVVTEYWDAKDQRWKMVDAEQSEAHVRHNKIDFDVTDIPHDRFIVGGNAWQTCRDGLDNSNSYGSNPGDIFRGMWAIRNRLVHDLATQNKVELLLWDTWGWLEWKIELSEDDLKLLDHVAVLTQAGDSAFDDMRALYENEHFKAPPVVMCYSPVAKWKEVKIK
jgi:hypothetical protein